MRSKTTFDKFTVFKANTGHEFIVDNEIADEVEKHEWCKDSGGYMCANFGGKVVRLHDFVMARLVGVKPKGVYVDHVNQDKLDDRVVNLRYVSALESSKNIPLRGNNMSGVTGVSQVKGGKWRAYITQNGKQISLGYYATISEAASARREAETRLGFKTRAYNVAKRCSVFDD